MQAETLESAADVFSDCFEQFAFMFAEPSNADEVGGHSGPFVKVTMTVSGVHTGKLTLFAANTLCSDLAINVLGMEEDEEVTEKDGQDACKEFLNILCGQLVTNLFGDQVVLDLSIPVCSACDLDEWRKETGDPQSMIFLVDDHPALLQADFERTGT